MAIRFYVAPQQGDGLSPQTAFRSILNDYMQPGETFEDIDHNVRRISIACVNASEATHTTIASDARVIVASRLYDNVLAAVDGLQETLNNLPGVAALKTKLEAIGVNTGWISGSNSLKDSIRYIFRTFAIANMSAVENNSHIKDIVARNLDTTVSEVPQAVRTGVRNWMQAKGLAIGWITNQTTVREILHFVTQNLGFGFIKMMGEDF